MSPLWYHIVRRNAEGAVISYHGMTDCETYAADLAKKHGAQVEPSVSRSFDIPKEWDTEPTAAAIIGEEPKLPYASMPTFCFHGTVLCADCLKRDLDDMERSGFGEHNPADYWLLTDEEVMGLNHQTCEGCEKYLIIMKDEGLTVPFEGPITSVADVEKFFHAVLSAGVSLHPDDSFLQTTNRNTGVLTFSPLEASRLDGLMEQAAEVCDREGADVYGVALECFTVYSRQSCPNSIGPKLP